MLFICLRNFTIYHQIKLVQSVNLVFVQALFKFTHLDTALKLNRIVQKNV